MQLTTHLNFNGDCEAAFKFYAETLGGKITFMMTQGESPMGDKVPEAMKDKSCTRRWRRRAGVS
jgi:PhnB protein